MCNCVVQVWVMVVLGGCWRQQCVVQSDIWPHLQRHVIRTWCQQVASWIPFDCIYFILGGRKNRVENKHNGFGFFFWRIKQQHVDGAYCVSLECLYGSVLAQFAHVNAHVRAAGGKRVVALPVHIQSRCWERKGEREDLCLQHYLPQAILAQVQLSFRESAILMSPPVLHFHLKYISTLI